MNPVNMSSLINNLYKAAEEKSNVDEKGCLELFKSIDTVADEITTKRSVKKLADNEQSKKVIETSKESLNHFDRRGIGETELLINWAVRNSHYDSNGKIEGAYKSLHHLLKAISKTQSGITDGSTLDYIDAAVLEKLKGLENKLESDLGAISQRWFDAMNKPMNTTQKTELYEDTKKLAKFIDSEKPKFQNLDKLTSPFKKFPIEDWGRLSHFIAQNSAYVPNASEKDTDTGGAYEAFSLLIDSISKESKEPVASTPKSKGKEYPAEELRYSNRHPKDILSGALNLMERSERTDIFSQSGAAKDAIRDTLLSNNEIIAKLSQTSKIYSRTLKEREIKDINAGRLSIEKLGLVATDDSAFGTDQIDAEKTLDNIIQYFGEEGCKQIKKLSITQDLSEKSTIFSATKVLAEKFPNLEDLSLKGLTLSNDDDIKNLNRLPLTSLTLVECMVENVDELSKSPTLQKLTLNQCDFEGTKKLKKTFEKTEKELIIN